MEADNASPPKSISKSKKSNGQLIDQILAEAKAHLTKKHKPSSDKSPLTANNKPKRASVNNDNIISELVNRELDGLSKKRKRHSKELNDSVAVLKKIKTEPVSEDEHNQNTQNETADGKAVSSPKSDKKGSYRSLSRERDELERLFSSAATSLVNSTINPFESSPHLKLTDLSISRIFKQEKQSSSEGEMPTPEPQRKQVPILRPVKEQIQSADETPTHTLSSFNSQRTVKDSTISTSTTVPFGRSDSSSSDNESTVPVAAHSSPVKKLVLEDKPTKRNSAGKSKSEKLQKRPNSKLLTITKKSNMNVSSHSQGNPNRAPINQPDSSSEEDALPPPPVKPKRRRSSVPAPIKTRASEDSAEELTLPTPIRIKQEKATHKQPVPVPKPIKTRASPAPDSSSEDAALPKPLKLKQEKPLSVPVQIKSQPTSDSEGDSETSTVPTPMVVKQEKEKQSVSVPRPIKQRVSSGSESDSGAPALPKPVPVKESAKKPKQRASAPASLGKVLVSGSEDDSAELAKKIAGEQHKAKRRKSHSCILMESAKQSSQKSVVKKQKSQSAKKQVAAAAPVEAPPATDSASDSEEEEPEEPRKKDWDLGGNSKTRRSLPEKITEKKSLTPNRQEESSSSGSDDEPVPKANVSQPEAKANGKDRRRQEETESSSSDAAGSSDEASDSGASRSEEKTTKSSPVKGKPQINNNTASESSSDEEAHSSNSSQRQGESGENGPVPKAVVLQTKFLHVAKPKRQQQEEESSSSDAGSSNEASDADSEQKPASQSLPLKGKPQLNNKDTSTDSSSDEEAASSRPSKASSEPRKTSLTPNKAKSASSKDSPASKSLPVNAAKGNKRRQPSESSLESDEAPPKKRSKRESLPESAPEPPVSAPKQQNLIVETNGLASESSDSEQETPLQSSISQKASWIENLNKNFPGLEQQHIKTTLPENSVKYSLLLVPKHINPSSLINLKCYLNKESPVSLNNMAYVFQPLPKKPDPVILSLKTPKLVDLESVIYFKQFLPKLPLNEIEVPVREDVSLPSVTKSRHPLFGVSYKKEIRLDHSVKQNLQQAVERKKKVMRKAKRKSKRKSTCDGVEENVLSIFNSISTGGDNLTNVGQAFADEDAEVAKGSKSHTNVEAKEKRKSKRAVSDEGLVEKKKKKKRKIVDE
ncbi:hypothetical protein HUJ04_002158 [Dendroctonus ponderosae]|uniref:Nucleolar protein dao-5-like n=1 Tax=Dendroctonus ponderosae TaxID=77166 RepID=A0AAR5Q0A7_DENPD|nr:hypothetical protein HUJ04_002158 [Dendroctonus ponderosae]KAH1009854.1 hypothetical protein HUJ04_002158 [Dendroctonus ponderosae]